ncbi:MAG: hypothetical protein Q4B73_01530 [Lachnospiraceae bacterium]|nr:hypothetical protein [Lachnospiraceae bacterium]
MDINEEFLKKAIKDVAKMMELGEKANASRLAFLTTYEKMVSDNMAFSTEVPADTFKAMAGTPAEDLEACLYKMEEIHEVLDYFEYEEKWPTKDFDEFREDVTTTIIDLSVKLDGLKAAVVDITGSYDKGEQRLYQEEMAFLAKTCSDADILMERLLNLLDEADEVLADCLETLHMDAEKAAQRAENPFADLSEFH